MPTKFSTRAQVTAYLNSDLIECLECGQRFAFLVNHLRRIHGMRCDEYREAWGLPAMTPLAGQIYRAKHREKIKKMQSDGRQTYDHLPFAAAKSIGTSKEKIGVAKTVHAALIAEIRPGDARRLPPGAKRADGRNADIARVSQQRRRAISACSDSRPPLSPRDK